MNKLHLFTIKVKQQISRKQCIEKYASFMRHIPIESFGKMDKLQQVHKQTSSTFYTPNDAFFQNNMLTLSRRRPLSYRNQSTDLLCITASVLKELKQSQGILGIYTKCRLKNLTKWNAKGCAFHLAEAIPFCGSHCFYLFYCV